ncbi:hypothetical protein AgCh_027584 [Apium graveolens]
MDAAQGCYSKPRDKLITPNDTSVLGKRKERLGEEYDEQEAVDKNLNPLTPSSSDFRVASAKDWSEEMTDIRKEIVDFHGEMVLLKNYSALNYTATWKKDKKKLNQELVDGLSTDVKSTDDEAYPLNDKAHPLNIETLPLKDKKTINKGKLAKIKEKYGSVIKNFV